ncbi:MAG: DnaJ domain-containing protein [Eggerthellaceae bacterium]|nr:DnaJ domain-containing protein [Eggerthellaceae bacterium]
MGLSEGASDDQVKAAHRKKVRESHPDKFAQNSVEYSKAEERTKLINEARDVLLSRKWKPEYTQRSPYSSPYANPYSGPYRPSGGAASGYPGQGSGYGYPGQGQGSGGFDPSNPFDGWPFGEGRTTWTWTSADGAGGANPFNPFNPFGTSNPFATQPPPQKSAEELKAQAKKDLIRDSVVFLVKVLIAVALALSGSFPFGLFLYVLITAIFAAWKRLKGCASSFFFPIVVVLVLSPVTIILGARAAMLTFVLIIVCAICLFLDVRNILRLIKSYRKH